MMHAAPANQVAPRRRTLAPRLVAAAVAMVGFALLLLAGKRLGEDVDFLGLSDRTIHFVGHVGFFGLLGVLLYKALGDRWLAAWVIANALAAGEEWRQQFIPGRRASLSDELVNLASITLALGLAWAVSRWRRGAKARRQHIAATALRTSH